MKLELNEFGKALKLFKIVPIRDKKRCQKSRSNKII